MNTQLDTALLTVEQAEYKWCPEARSFIADDDGDNGVTLNRRMDGRPHLGSRCLGDRCMFWRWHDQGERWQKHAAVSQATWIEGHTDGAGEYFPAAFTDAPQDGRDWLLDEEEGYWYVPTPPLPPRGYCGKAGHPHAAQLVESQMELLTFQLHEHRRCA